MLVDPAFTIVFLVAMWIYSTKLFFISVLTIPAYIAVAVLVTRPLPARISNSTAAMPIFIVVRWA